MCHVLVVVTSCGNVESLVFGCVSGRDGRWRLTSRASRARALRAAAMREAESSRVRSWQAFSLVTIKIDRRLVVLSRSK